MTSFMTLRGHTMGHTRAHMGAHDGLYGFMQGPLWVHLSGSLRLWNHEHYQSG